MTANGAPRVSCRTARLGLNEQSVSGCWVGPERSTLLALAVRLEIRLHVSFPFLYLNPVRQETAQRRLGSFGREPPYGDAPSVQPSEPK